MYGLDVRVIRDLHPLSHHDQEIFASLVLAKSRCFYDKKSLEHLIVD